MQYETKSILCLFFFFSSRRRHTRCSRDWSSDVCSSDLLRSCPELTVQSPRGGPWLPLVGRPPPVLLQCARKQDRKSTRLNSSHGYISYAVFCLKKKKIYTQTLYQRST